VIAAADERARTRWTQVDRAAYTADRRGHFVGYITASPGGGYLVFDKDSEVLGHHQSLVEAQAAFTRATRSPGRTRKGRVPTLLAQAALVAAGAGFAVAAGEVLVRLA